MSSASGTSEKFNLQTQLEHLQSKYVGTGHADVTKHEWVVNQYRDTLSSVVSHVPTVLSYNAVAENESVARLRFRYLQKMFQPCGVAPQRDDAS